MSCTCVKDHTITCRVHPLEYEQIEVMGKHIAELEAEVEGLRKLLYIVGWSDAGINRAIKEVEDESDA
jgi:hypothetical protein